MATKYKAVIDILSPGYLLGGTKRHESSWFDSFDDAKSFMVQSIEVNKGRDGFADADIRGQVIGREFGKEFVRAVR
jgi:hypothetical protein